jgi:ABC-2 type transport system permease protein
MADSTLDPATAARPHTSTLARLFRLWGLYARLDLIWVSRDLAAFVGYYLSDLLISLAGITGTLLLAQRFAGIGGWSRHQVLFMLGWSLLVTGVQDTFFNFNVGHISRRLGRGQFDHTLVQPQPLWMALLTDGFAPFSGGGAFLPGLLLCGWASAAIGLRPSAGWWLAAGGNLLASAAVTLAFSWIWGSLAFWAPRAAEEISTSAMDLTGQLKGFPLDGAGRLLLGGLTVGVPVAFVAWYPCRALLGLDSHPMALWLTPLAAIAFAAAAAGMFRLGLKQYGRTGSQRYHLLGHRR